jgi:hypothetical protein
MSSQKKNPFDLDPVTKGAIQLAVHIQSTFLDLSCSTATRHFFNRVLELHCVETTTCAAQLEAYLPAALVEQFP